MSRLQFGKLLELKTPQSDQELLEFRKFLCRQYCSENLTFWLEAEEFKSITDDPIRKSKARLMWENYFSSTSSHEVNIPDSVKKQLQERVQNQNVDSSLFQQAQCAVFELMVEQCYPQFLQRSSQSNSPPKFADYHKNNSIRTDSYANFQKYVATRRASVTSFIDEHPNLDKSNSDSTFDITTRVKEFQCAPRPASFSDLNSYNHKSSDEILLKLKAGSLQLTTRVSTRMSCGDFVKKQIRKTDLDASKTYAIYVAVRKQWLENCRPLSAYKELLTNSHLTFELKEKAVL